MTVRVVHRLEVIQIDEQHTELVSESRRAVDLSLQCLIKMARVVEPGAVVRDGEFLNSLHPACILDGDGSVVAKRLQEKDLLLSKPRHVDIDQLNHAQHPQL